MRTSAVGEAEDPAGNEPLPQVDDESFESAIPTELPRGNIDLPVTSTSANGNTDPSASRPPPALEDIVQKLPPETRSALDELFRARFTTVRRIRPDQLQ